MGEFILLKLKLGILQNLQINHDLTDRVKFLAVLFKTLKLHHMSRSFLINHVRKHKLINQNEHCKELVMTTYEHLLMPNDDQIKLHETPKRIDPEQTELAFSNPEDIEPGNTFHSAKNTTWAMLKCKIFVKKEQIFPIDC